jgi:serine-type D-Ala-D-Ala endopeptidase (penicillin-binding protein 7)
MFPAPLNSGASVVRVSLVHRNKAYRAWFAAWSLVFGLGLAPVAEAAKPRAPASPLVAKTVKAKKPVRSVRARKFTPPPPTLGQRIGLHAADDPLDLRSGVALVMDQDTNEVLLAKNSRAVLPIASITKLMTALVVAEARLPLHESLMIDQDDVDTEKGSRSRLRVGTRLTREEMLHLALMASENRAANALGRHYPGGLSAFVAAMNRKAHALGMTQTRYVEPTGLSSQNQSNATDLALLVREADKHELIRRLSTSLEAEMAVGAKRPLQFRNTNGLVRNGEWEIGLQKTGYIAEAGRCVVMQAHLSGRKLIMVLLDSAGKYSRIGDAERIRRWLTDLPSATAPAEAPDNAAATPAAVGGDEV